MEIRDIERHAIALHNLRLETERTAAGLEQGEGTDCAMLALALRDRAAALAAGYGALMAARAILTTDADLTEKQETPNGDSYNDALQAIRESL